MASAAMCRLVSLLVVVATTTAWAADSTELGAQQCHDTECLGSASQVALVQKVVSLVQSPTQLDKDGGARAVMHNFTFQSQSRALTCGYGAYSHEDASINVFDTTITTVEACAGLCERESTQSNPCVAFSYPDGWGSQKGCLLKRLKWLTSNNLDVNSNKPLVPDVVNPCTSAGIYVRKGCGNCKGGATSCGGCPQSQSGDFHQMFDQVPTTYSLTCGYGVYDMYNSTINQFHEGVGSVQECATKCVDVGASNPCVAFGYPERDSKGCFIKRLQWLITNNLDWNAGKPLAPDVVKPCANTKVYVRNGCENCIGGAPSCASCPR